MPETQSQSYCIDCDQLTLHVRTVEPPQHAIHILMILLCCGAWLPFYVLLCIFPKKYPWRCSICGTEARESAAAIRDEERHDQWVEREAERERKREEWEASAPEREAAALARKKAIAQGAKNVEAAASNAFAFVIQQLGNAFKTANAVLLSMSGGDSFLLRMWQVIFGIVSLGIAGLVARQLMIYMEWI